VAPSGRERLQKILSHAGVASRRASERLMLDGRVTVNGLTVRELGAKADPAHDDVRVDGRRIKPPERRRYILLNKPRGCVTTRFDPAQRPTVMDLLVGVSEYVYPVGRLDHDSEGLLLLTNDGGLAARLMHPRHGVVRVYEARVLGTPTGHELQRLARGVIIDGRRTQPADVKVLNDRQRPASESVHAGRVRARAHDRTGTNPPPASTLLEITVREGRNRQVRKMCDAIGHPVERLKRVAIGPIRDERLKPGRWRDLSVLEVSRLKRSAGDVDVEAS
jgi:pseudouridine synthase